MKNRSVTLMGSRTITENNGFGTPTVVVEQTVPRMTESLLVFQDVTNGNRITPNPHHFQKTIVYYPAGSTRTIRLPSGKEGSVTGNNVYSLEPSFTLNSQRTLAYNQAVSRLYDCIRGQLDLSVSLAESGQVVRMLRAVAKVSSYIRSFRPSEIGNKWLEYQYGWKPLLADVYAVADKLVAKPTSPERFIKATGSARQGNTWRSASGSFTPSNVYTTEVGTRSDRCLIQCNYKFSNSIITELAGWTSLNPLSIAWELTPYSFVADWFIDIGGYLRNTESALAYGQAFSSGFVTYGTRTHQTVAKRGTESQTSFGQTITNYHDVEQVRIFTEKKREILASNPLPRLPSFKANLGSSQLISAAALLSQFIRR